MYYKFEEWIEKNKWILLGGTVFIIYMLMFNIQSARFICNDNICRIEHINATGKNIIRTTEVNLDTIQCFEIRRGRRYRRARGHIRYNRYYYVFAVNHTGKAYNFFKCHSHNKESAQIAIDYLNEEIVKQGSKNIDITYPYISINGKRVDVYEQRH